LHLLRPLVSVLLVPLLRGEQLLLQLPCLSLRLHELRPDVCKLQVRRMLPAAAALSHGRRGRTSRLPLALDCVPAAQRGRKLRAQLLRLALAGREGGGRAGCSCAGCLGCMPAGCLACLQVCLRLQQLLHQRLLLCTAMRLSLQQLLLQTA
jgi:hypothetical protein